MGLKTPCWGTHCGRLLLLLSGDIARADEGNRTPNLLITNQLLYQLSYVSLNWPKKTNFPSPGQVATNTTRALPAKERHSLVESMRLQALTSVGTPT